MKPYLLVLLLVATALSGCTGPAFERTPMAFGVKFANNTDEHYIIYIQLRQDHPNDTWGNEEPFPPNGGGFTSLYDCQGHLDSVPDPIWMRIELREPDGNERVHADSRGPVFFRANWTGLHCGEEYNVIYNGPDDVKAFEIYDRGNDERKKRDLERVPP